MPILFWYQHNLHNLILIITASQCQPPQFSELGIELKALHILDSNSSTPNVHVYLFFLNLRQTYTLSPKVPYSDSTTMGLSV